MRREQQLSRYRRPTASEYDESRAMLNSRKTTTALSYSPKAHCRDDPGWEGIMPQSSSVVEFLLFNIKHNCCQGVGYQKTQPWIPKVD